MRGFIMYAAYCKSPRGAECSADVVDVWLEWIGMLEILETFEGLKWIIGNDRN